MRRLQSATAAAFWDLHSLTWDGGAPPAAVAARTAAVLAWARAHAAPGARVLDVGCATGTHALALATAGYHVVGIDHAPGMLRHARAKAARLSGAAVTFVHADLARPLPPTLGGFDLVLCLGVLQCVPDAAALLTALCGVLAPSGVVLLEAKDAAAPPPVAAGHSAASRTFAPLKRWASARGARPFTRAQLAAALGAAGLCTAEDRGASGWLRVAARAGERTSGSRTPPPIALRGYAVDASDLSPGAVARLRRELATRGLGTRATVSVHDLRTLDGVRDVGACRTRVRRSRYCAVPIARLLELLAAAGFVDVAHRGDVLFQPVLTGRRAGVA